MIKRVSTDSNPNIISIIIVAALLTLFSFFYSDFSPKITGLVTYTLTINIVGSGSASIGGGSGVNSCNQPQCIYEYDENSDLEILFSPSPGWQFAGLQGCGGGDRCVINIDDNYAITVTFTRLSSGSGGLIGGPGVPLIPSEIFQSHGTGGVPEAIVYEVYENAVVISDGANYASNVGIIVTEDINLPEIELNIYRNRLVEIISSSSELYKSSSEISKSYQSAQIIEYYKENMVQNIAEIEKQMNKVGESLTKTVSERQEIQKENAFWELDRNSRVEATTEISNSFISNLPKTLAVSGNGSTNTTNCTPLNYLIAVRAEESDFGSTGYDTSTGNRCVIEQVSTYTRANYLIPVPIEGDLNDPLPGERRGIDTVHFSRRTNRDYEAVIINRKQGPPTFRFFSSPSYSNLEEKISEFVNGIVYGEGEENPSYLTGLTLHQAEDKINELKKFPWVLWVILVSMTGFFLFFEQLTQPHHERLISYGKKAVEKRDYFNAIKKYNELASTYSEDQEIRQDILNYLELIKSKVGRNKLELYFVDKKAPPLIKTSHLINAFSNYAKVENMIHHTIEDIKKSPKLAKSRMLIIAQEYSKLDNKEKERLAHKYESLVYKIAKIK